MNRIERRQEIGGLDRERIIRQTAEAPLALEIGKERLHLGADMFGIAEHAASLGNPHGAVATSPSIDVLKEMMVDRAIVTNAKTPGRQRFFGPKGGGNRLESLEGGRFAKVGDVP